MSQIPSWPGLKNVQNVITLDFSDGNTFWDILKVQESRAAYFQTNYKNVEKQIVTIDANKEALAYIAMDVETYDNELKGLKALYDDNHEENNTSKELTAPIDNNHWRLGAPQHCLMTSKLSTMFPDNPILHTLTEDISNVVRQYLCPSEILSTGYKIIPYKCVHIHYTSLEDWKVEKDIAHCNPSLSTQTQMYYLNHMVDADMFLRCETQPELSSPPTHVVKLIPKG
ncbi:hypothetical protein BU17DRAFT_64644 [Hysterangium stoloniferum]|nr:hypothetical protein BU17DRAFT_64644 [Hysterangium stoloniferum]